jgi:chaperone required for assembly of F1-ATPase
LLAAAQAELSPKALGELISVLTKLQRENMDRMQEDISWFIKKFDYRYEKESWGNSKDAVERTVNKLRGWCVGKEPNPEEK